MLLNFDSMMPAHGIEFSLRESTDILRLLEIDLLSRSGGPTTLSLYFE
jgi:hypothetical protein